MTNTQKQTVHLFSEALPLAFTDQGVGRAFLLLHGGASIATMSGLAGALSQNARAITPIHPGFEGEPRPDWFTRIDDLVMAYLALIERLDLRDVIVVGNSVGGWIAAEMALRQSPRIAGVVILNGVGIDTGASEKTIVDPMKVSPSERAVLAFHNPAQFAIVPASPEAAAVMEENRRALHVYAGEPFMYDPKLRARLAQVSVPAMVVWGESDQIVDADYGRLYASSIPGARFELISEAGHFPQIERLDEVVRLIGEFVGRL